MLMIGIAMKPREHSLVETEPAPNKPLSWAREGLQVISASKDYQYISTLFCLLYRSLLYPAKATHSGYRSSKSHETLASLMRLTEWIPERTTLSSWHCVASACGRREGDQFLVLLECRYCDGVLVVCSGMTFVVSVQPMLSYVSGANYVYFTSPQIKIPMFQWLCSSVV